METRRMNLIKTELLCLRWWGHHLDFQKVLWNPICKPMV